MSVMLTGMGVLMLMVGVLGEYLWRVLDEARGRPKYVIEETAGETSGLESGAVLIRDARLDREASCGSKTTEVRVNGESR